MSFESQLLVETLVTGTINHLEKIGLNLTEKQINYLIKDLSDELNQDFRLQKRTPTQVVNNFIEKEFELNLNLTPNDFGEEGRVQIIFWGIEKAKQLDEK
tara:strand:- start:18 stop:317 length:300 start_codon:yes stop_codon:yes gene_type:complete